MSVLEPLRKSSRKKMSILDAVRSSSMEKLPHPISPFDQIKIYAEDFYISDEELRRLINRKAVGENFDQKCQNFLNGILEIKQLCIDKAAHSDKALKSYQLKALDYMITHRGMVAAFEMGSGKTLTAVVISYCIVKLVIYFEVDQGFRVMLIIPPSIEENFIAELRDYRIEPNIIDTYYGLYRPQKLSNDMNNGKIDCRKTLVIIDEAHNMRKDFMGNFTVAPRNITGTARQGRVANMVICASESWKVLLLTGTPIYNSTVDIVNLAAMVKGIEEPSGEDPYILIQQDKAKFQEYYRDVFLFHENDHHLFPERKDIVVNILMTRAFLRQYEELETNFERDISSEGQVKRGRGRPKEEEGDIDQTFEITRKDGRGRNAYMAPLRTAINRIIPQLKCFFIVDKVKEVLSRNEKVLIFSDFKETGGKTIYQSLKENNINCLVVDGELEPKFRDIYVQRFNKDEVMVLIVTRVGGEGFDLKGVRHIFAYEKNWNIATMEQYIARGIRYKSHEHLPPDQRNVTVYHLMLIKPSDYHNMPEQILNYSENDYITYEEGSTNLRVANPDRPSVDIYMFCRALEKKQKMDVLEKELKKIQIGSGGRSVLL